MRYNRCVNLLPFMSPCQGNLVPASIHPRLIPTDAVLCLRPSRHAVRYACAYVCMGMGEGLAGAQARREEQAFTAIRPGIGTPALVNIPVTSIADHPSWNQCTLLLKSTHVGYGNDAP